MNYVIIIAGGVGSRLGAKVPKQFVEVLGKPIIAYTMEHFQNHSEIDGIELVCVDGYQEHLQGIADKFGITKVMKIVKGGSEYERSIMNGVAGLEGIAKPDDVVMIHWSASPFINEEMITDNIRVCKEKGNAISTTDFYVLSGKKKSTVSVSDPENYSEEYIDRETVAVMNSPHAFKYGFIDDLYKEAIESGVIDTVEPHTTTLMYAMGKKIYFALGSQNNIKITRKEDLDLFEGYVLMKQKHGEWQ